MQSDLVHLHAVTPSLSNHHPHLPVTSYKPLPRYRTPSTINSLHTDAQLSASIPACPNYLSLRRSPPLPYSQSQHDNRSSTEILSFNDIPHTHLTIILNVLSNLTLSSTFTVQVSQLYTITLGTHILYSLP